MTVTTVDPRPLPHSCGGCANRWDGNATSHCGACHVTTSSPSAFDRHRRNGTCQAPATVGLVELGRAGYTVWGSPSDEASIERFRALRGAA